METDMVSFGKKKLPIINALDLIPKMPHKPLTPEETETFMRHIRNKNLGTLGTRT